jgi:hypothetical protein
VSFSRQLMTAPDEVRAEFVDFLAVAGTSVDRERLITTTFAAGARERHGQTEDGPTKLGIGLFAGTRLANDTPATSDGRHEEGSDS